MSPKSEQVMRFLSSQGWGGAKQCAVTGDLSDRRYTRLAKGERTAILMEDANIEMVAQFAKIARWLLRAGLSAPRVFAEDFQQGLLLLEDFGEAKLTEIINAGTLAQRDLYKIAVDALLQVRGETLDGLEAPNAAALIDATRIADEWYPNVNTHELDEIRRALSPLLSELLTEPRSVAMRDFHADNVLWLERREGVQRLGLLDFQDAFLMHPAYDLMSLITDARINVPFEVKAATLSAYSVGSGEPKESLERAVAILGVQRNIRILGIFWRAAQRDGKRHHLPALPRVRAHLADCLAHPVFDTVRDRLDSALPLPAIATT